MGSHPLHLAPRFILELLALGNWINFGVKLLLAGIIVGIFRARRMVPGELSASITVE